MQSTVAIHNAIVLFKLIVAGLCAKEGGDCFYLRLCSETLD